MRIAYTLGNLTMTNNDVRYVIADAVLPPLSPSPSPPSSIPSPSPSPSSPAVSPLTPASPPLPGGLEVVLALLARTLKREAKLRAMAASAVVSVGGGGGGGVRGEAVRRENGELVVKLVRLVANLVIHAEVGERVLTDERMGVLMQLLPVGEGDGQGGTGREEVAINAVSCMVNLSYYHPPSCRTFLTWPVAEVMGWVVPLLCVAESPLLPHLLLLLGNLTRGVEGVRWLEECRGDEAVLMLMWHGEGEVRRGALGVVVNMTGAEGGRRKVRGEGEEEGGGEWVRVMLDMGDEDEGGEGEEGERKGRDGEERWEVRGLVGKALCNLRGEDGLRGVLGEEVRAVVVDAMGRWLTELGGGEDGEGEDEARTVELRPILTCVYDAAVK